MDDLQNKDGWQTFELEGGELFGLVTVRLHPDVISQVNDEWRKQFYPLDEPNEIACHIAYNAIANHWGLSQLDGFANLPDEFAEVEWE